MGIYAPITNPDAADRIPKNAVLAPEDLKESTIIIKRAVADTDPRATPPIRRDKVYPEFLLPQVPP